MDYVAINDLTITSVSAAYRIPNLLVNRGLTLHTQNNCLSCYKIHPRQSINASPKSSIPNALRVAVESLSLVPSLPSDKLDFSDKDLSKSNSVIAKPDEGPTVDVASNVHNVLKEKSIQDITEEGQKKDKAIIEVLKRKEVLKLVGCMNATVGAKTAEQGLLRYNR